MSFPEESSLEDFEKIQRFDRVYRLCKEIYEKAESGGAETEDRDIVFESVMEDILGIDSGMYPFDKDGTQYDDNE